MQETFLWDLSEQTDTDTLLCLVSHYNCELLCNTSACFCNWEKKEALVSRSQHKGRENFCCNSGIIFLHKYENDDSWGLLLGWHKCKPPLRPKQHLFTLLSLSQPAATGASESSRRKRRVRHRFYSFYSIPECHGDVEDFLAHINLLCCLQERWKDLW